MGQRLVTVLRGGRSIAGPVYLCCLSPARYQGNPFKISYLRDRYLGRLGRCSLERTHSLLVVSSYVYRGLALIHQTQAFRETLSGSPVFLLWIFSQLAILTHCFTNQRQECFFQAAVSH